MRPDDYDRHEDGYVLASIALREQQQRALREQRPKSTDGGSARQLADQASAAKRKQ